MARATQRNSKNQNEKEEKRFGTGYYFLALVIGNVFKVTMLEN